MKIEKNDMVMVYDGGGTVPHCKYTGRFGDLTAYWQEIVSDAVYLFRLGESEKTYGRSEKFLAFKVCFYDTLVPTREYKSGYAADRFARKCAAQGLWCSLHGLAVADGSCEWVEISAC